MKKTQLLLIEGDQGHRETAGTALRDSHGGWLVTDVPTLADALGRRISDFDLVLSEWTLPDARGSAVLDALRAHGARGVVVLTDANVPAVAAEAVRSGATDYLVRHKGYLSTLPLAVEKNLAAARLRAEHDALQRQLQEQNETLSELMKSLESAAATDPLTSLYNRRHFAVVLDQLFADAERAGTDLTCVMLDMDGFKQLNDNFGHQSGDAALILAASEITANLRKGDVAARYGGDEFVMLLPRAASLDGASVARRIADAYNSEMSARGYRKLPVGMSFGVASVSCDRPSKPDALVAAADAALYRAKRLGRDMVFISGIQPVPQALAG